MAIITRSSKGSELTHAEMDNNFVELRDSPYGKVFPKTKGIGVKVDTDNPTFGWHDLSASTYIDVNSVNAPNFSVWHGAIKAFQFNENSEMLCRFHLPHDYVPGTDIFIHVHWTHNSSLVTGGSITWAWEHTYAKGHNQAVFEPTKLLAVVQSASLTPYQHMIAETALSVSGGSTSELDTDIIEVDGLIMSRFYIDSNDLIVTGGGIVEPFVHFIDIHYQSTGLPTKSRSPDFWT